MKSLTEIEPRRPVSTYGTNLTASGSYYLTTNLVSTNLSTDAITIAADNLKLDLNGFALINTSGDSNQADGVSFASRRNVTIRNGTIQGFYRGINGTGASPGILVENLKLASNYFRGMLLQPSTGVAGGIVRNNFVRDTGGTTVGVADQEIRGIECCCGSFVVMNNFVTHVQGKGTLAGYGIHLNNSLDTFAVGNFVSQSDFGIHMNGPNEYRDNFTSNCNTNHVAGTDRGNNF